MKTRMIQWVMAATLICGASVFASCTNNGDNPSPEPQKKDRAEFIQHTRKNLKDLAMNLNFESWSMANDINQHFNKYVLLNPQFQSVIAPTFIAMAQSTIKPVEESSELAQMGYKMYGTVDFTSFNYRFSMNNEGTSFDIEPADNFEMLIHYYNPMVQQLVPLGMKLTLKASDSSFLVLMKGFSTQDFAVVGKMPTEFEYAISTNLSGEWEDIFWGTFKNEVKQGGSSDYINRMTDVINISGVVNTSLPADPKNGYKGDATTLTFAIGQSPEENKASLNCALVQNGREMIQMNGVMKNLIDQPIDIMQFTKAPNLIEAIIAMISGINLEEGNVTLLNDLTASLKIDNCGEALGLVFAMSNARRNYADYQVIEQYTEQLNQIVTASMTCQGLNQHIPMRLQTAKIGIDYWAVPALNFADENGYVTITDMLDKENIEYMFNIADHAAVPMYKSVIVVGQLMRYMQTLMGNIKQQQQQQQQQ